MNTAPTSGHTPWKPPVQSLQFWWNETAGEHPLLQNPRYPENPYLAEQVAMLLGTNTNAFTALSEQLTSTANLAEITAQGLEDAKAAEWQGQAADQYRHTLGKLPKDLNHVSQSFAAAIGPLWTFADTTVQLKGQYEAFVDEVGRLKGQWAAALETTYPDEQTGWAAIHRLQRQLLDQNTNGTSIVGKAGAALDELHRAVSPLYPRENLALLALKGMWHMVEGTPGAVTAFARDPSWSNLGTMTQDLGFDASVIVLAAGMAVPGLDAADAGAEAIVVTRAVGSAAQGAELGLGAMNAASNVAQHQYASGALAGLGTALGAKGILGSQELGQAAKDVQLLDTCDGLLENNMNPNDPLFFSPEDIKRLEFLVGSYVPKGEITDPWAVKVALQKAQQNFVSVQREDGLIGAPKSFGADQLWNGASNATSGIAPGANNNPPVSTGNGSGSGG